MSALIKFAGILLVMGSSIMGGLYMAFKESYRIKDLRQMKSAMMVLRSEIEYGLTPLPEAMANAASKTSSPVSDIFSHFGESISYAKLSVYEIWCASLEVFRKESYFSTEDIEYFKAFGKALGYLDKNMQIANIDMIINYMEDKLQEVSKTSEKNKKLYSSLGVLSGLLVLVLLI